MLITSITKQKADRYEIYVDGESYGVLDGVVLLSHRLKVGLEIEEEELFKIKRESGTSFAFADGIKYLSRARHTENEVRGKLNSKGYEDEAIDGALKKLRDYGYVDDEGYAKAYVSVYGASRGKNRLRYELSLKGVSREIIEGVLPDDEYRSAYLLAEKKKSRYDSTEKLVRYLLSRGFEYEVARRVASEVEKL